MNARRKRRKLSKCFPTVDGDSTGFTNNQNELYSRAGRLTLETLPPEVFEMILRLLPCGDVAGSIRLVSRQCSAIASAVLNAAFITAGTRLDSTMNYIKSTIPNSTISSDLIIRRRVFNILELIKTQYKMLKAVTWRYTHPPSKTANFNRICFYAGTLLDELNTILDLARIRPRALWVTNSRTNSETGLDEVIANSSTDSSQRLNSFVALCKRFMNYFEKVSECKVNKSALISGCKAVDVLDCLAVGREVTGFRVSSERARSRDSRSQTTSSSGSIVTMRLRYVMRRAWFTCLQVPCAADENSWREDQRFMYLRLRRLVGSVNEHYYEKLHFQRELLQRPNLNPSRRRLGGRLLRPPPASTYSGYGVYGGRFFYYGNMNKWAYESKLKDLTDESSNESDEQDDALDESERPNVSSHRPAAFDLVIRVDLRCSSELAPLAVFSSLRKSELDQSTDNSTAAKSSTKLGYSRESPELYLKLSITCPASTANRLPGNFTWEQRGSLPHLRKGRRTNLEQRFSR